MKISAQEEYGLRCLLSVARPSPTGAHSLRQIAEAEGISTAYAGKLLWILGHAGLVKSSRGPKGGYSLALPASEIRLSNVIKVLDDDEMDHHCQSYSGDLDACIHTECCTIRPVVEGLHSLVRDALSRVTLEQLMLGQTGGMINLTRIRDSRTDAANPSGLRPEHRSRP